jgi:hypothetical protein
MEIASLLYFAIDPDVGQMPDVGGGAFGMAQPGG